MAKTILINTSHNTITASSGTAAATILSSGGLMKQLFVKPATSSTTFDVSITDVYDNVVFEREDNTGILNELEVNLPEYGNYTLTVSNASADEAFAYVISSLE